MSLKLFLLYIVMLRITSRILIFLYSILTFRNNNKGWYNKVLIKKGANHHQTTDMGYKLQITCCKPGDLTDLNYA